MATIEQNRRIWDSEDHWEKGSLGDGVPLQDGEKWSRPWGGAARQWEVTILPRIKQFLPAENVLEIAPGRGRWTSFLKEFSSHLTVVDLSPNCIKYCRERFKDYSHLSYFVNDGRTLQPVPDSTVDFVFSFDSLVHIDLEDIASYISEIARVLAPAGYAFLHHSNLGFYSSKILSSTHMRAQDVSRVAIKTLAQKSGLVVVEQECIPWSPDNVNEGIYLDCFTRLAASGRHDKVKIWDNALFLNEQSQGLGSKGTPLV